MNAVSSIQEAATAASDIVASGFSAEDLDRRLTQARTVTSAWSLPQLPDLVQLDLAMAPEIGDVATFLSGISADIEEAQRPQRLELEYADRIPEEDPQLAQFRRLLAPDGAERIYQSLDELVSPLDPPELLATDSVQRFKMEAVLRGYLPEDTPIDGRWSPELNSLRYEMGYDSFRETMGGERFGAQSLDGVARWMRDWLSPAGLLQAATQLDLLWDFKAIGREASDWGDKWRSWFDDPFDLGKLTDALTGPLDDLILPAVNLALLASGVGGVRLAAQTLVRGVQGVRVAENAYRVTRYGQMLNRLSQGGRLARGAASVGQYARGLVRAEDVVADVRRLAEPGFLAVGLQRLGGSTRLPQAITSTARFTGDRMADWRQLRMVVATKQANRQVLRMGVASRLENALLNTSGLSPADFGLTVDPNKLGDSSGESVALLFAEPLLMPSSIFTPGSVVRPVFRGAREIIHRAVQLPDTAAADEVAGGINAVIDDWLSQGRVTKEQRDRFVRAYTRHGAGQALTELYGSKESAGLQVLWYRVLAAIDSRVATELESIVGLQPGTSRYEDLRRLMRANYVGQVRDVNEDNLEQIAQAWAISEAAGRSSPRSRMKLFREITASLDDDTQVEFLRAWARQHNENRAQFVHDLLQNEGSTPGLVRGYIERSGIADALDPERFHDFLIASSVLWDFERTADLSMVRFAPAIDDEGRRLGVMSPSRIDDTLAATLRRSGTMPTHELARKVDPLISDFKDPAQRLTVGRKDGVWKQDYVVFHSRVRRALNLVDEIERMRRDPKVRQFLEQVAEATEGIEDDTIRRRLIANIIDEHTNPGISPTGGKPFTHRADRALRVLRRMGVGLDLDRAYEVAVQRLRDLDESPDWSLKFGVAQFDDFGRRLDLKARLRELRRRTKYVAAEVDMDSLNMPPEMRAEIERAGYTVVTGVEFLEPVDLLIRISPMREIAESIVRKATLSTPDPSTAIPDSFLVRSPLEDLALDDPSVVERAKLRLKARGYGATQFFERQDPHLVGTLMRARFERELLRELRELKARGRFPGDVSRIDSPDVQHVIRLVNEHIEDLKETAAQAIDQAYANGGPLERYLARLSNLRTPQGLGDVNYRRLEAAFADPAIANAVLRAAKRSRDIGTRYRGLATIEDRLRSETVLQSALRTAKYGLPFAAAYGTATVAGGFMSDDEKSLWEAVPGLLAGVGSAVLLRRPGAVESWGRAVDRIGRLGQDAAWFRFTMLGDNLAQLRDYARFALNPYFDLSRYTEGLVMAQTTLMPELSSGRLARLPVLNSKRAYVRRYGQAEWDRVLAQFREAQRGRYDFDAVDTLTTWFNERGMFGYSPQERMAAAFGELMRQGVDPETAFQTAKNIFTYGTTGRSGAELSVNFVFFPFSFQKKYLGTVGRWMTDDLTRAIVFTDALRMYEILDERYELSEFLKEHLPALENLRELNALGFGISPGRFGGVNRPFIDTGLGLVDQVPVLGDTLDPIQNLFLPQAVTIDGIDAAEALKETVRSTLPAYNDLQKLWRTTRDQAYVITSPSHRTPQADIREAWKEWRTFKAEVDRMMRQAGHAGIRTIYSDPDQDAARHILRQKKAKIMEAHPAWMESIAEVVHERVLLAEELNYRRYRPDASLAERAIGAFADVFDIVEADLRTHGMSFDENPEDVPEETYVALRQEAIRQALALGGMVSQAGGEYLTLYERFFEDLLGPITRELR